MLIKLIHYEFSLVDKIFIPVLIYQLNRFPACDIQKCNFIRMHRQNKYQKRTKINKLFQLIIKNDGAY